LKTTELFWRLLDIALNHVIKCYFNYLAAEPSILDIFRHLILILEYRSSGFSISVFVSDFESKQNHEGNDSH